MEMGSSIRRAAAAFALAVAVVAITGTGAQAGRFGLPEILSGQADAQALQIDLQLPSTTSLNKALGDLGIPTVALPGGLLGNRITQTVSLLHGEVMRTVKADGDHASGFAAPLQGLLGGADKVTSRCDSADCSGQKSGSGATINVLDDVIPGGIGTITAARADSISSNVISTQNFTKGAAVNLNLANLFAIPELKPLADALGLLTDTVNNEVLPVVNPVLDDLGNQLDGLTKGTALEGVLTVAGADPIPNLTKVDLINLEVLSAFANVRPLSPTSGPGKGVKGLLAESHAKVGNIDILGSGANAWASLDAVGLTARTFANGVASAATADADVEIVGANLGGILDARVSAKSLRDLTNGNGAKDVIKQLNLPADQEADLLAAVDILTNVAGISVQTFGKTVNPDPKGNFATATAGTLDITIEPKIPVPAAIAAAPKAGVAVPSLKKSDYVSTGLILKVSLPNASAASSIGKVLPQTFPPPATTGVGVPFFAAAALLGGALLVRRFGLAA